MRDEGASERRESTRSGEVSAALSLRDGAREGDGDRAGGSPLALGLARERGWAGLRSPGGPAGSWATSDGREKPGGLLGWPKERKGVSFHISEKEKSQGIYLEVQLNLKLTEMACDYFDIISKLHN